MRSSADKATFWNGKSDLIRGLASSEGSIKQNYVHGLFSEIVALREGWPLLRVATYNTGGPLYVIKIIEYRI